MRHRAARNDERARHLAARVIYNECPRDLPAEHYARIAILSA
jgi:hypothetical protein